MLLSYRSLSVGVVKDNESLTTGHMLLLASLGWLFEVLTMMMMALLFPSLPTASYGH